MNNMEVLKSKFKSISPILMAMSLVMVALGLSLFYINAQSTFWSWTLASFLIFIGCLSTVVLFWFLFTKNKQTVENSYKTQDSLYGRWRTPILIVLLIIASVGFLGISHYIAGKFPTPWDVTVGKQHTMTSNTIKLVSSLNKNVELTALHVGTPPKYLQDLFNNYERLSNDFITTQIIDPIENISFAATFGNVVNSDEQKVIVQSDNVRQDVDFTKDLLTEEQLTNAIARVTREPAKVYFLQGHGEYSTSNQGNIGLSTFKQLLDDNNIQSYPLMLGITPEIPTDCDVLIIAGPKTNLTTQEQTLITNYLRDGGDALFLIEHSLVTTPDQPLTDEQQQLNPSLNEIINQWGLNVESDVVVDLTNHIGNDVGSPATKNYQNHKAITADLDYTFYVRPRSIKIVDGRRPTIKLAVIAATASKDQSWAETNRYLEVQYDAGVDTIGPVPMSYVVLEEHKGRHAGDGVTLKAKSDTRLIVFTDADFLTNVYINQYSNSKMGLNVVNWLADLDYQTLMSSNQIKVERLDLTSQQKRVVVVILFFLPFLIALFGLVVWMKTKVN
ncbi:Gldg family protein [Psychrosphaera sp. 1_MG-2023]|uniref:Gldg family protein n=1 Tax=Psychrosphaera sp. 1_MG-2023 TaxID=3062643 RepID=UPI0026E32441|nr:Gldg family protein [Psychrosphaera sp. 1_MG-2023]MDO6717957.1 Gldg family protein [Psychrosphaera sp. 1_MG-2023]